ncbi:MAG: N-6 DNA methylase [Polaromonas sp.]
MKSLAAELLAHGIPADAVVEFGAEPKAREVRYLDLFKAHGDTEKGVLPAGVIESAARPAVYFRADGGLGGAELSRSELQDLIRTLACRADARYLALISPGVVTVYKIGFFDSSDEIHSIFETEPGAFRLRNLISGLDLPSLDSVANTDKQWLEGHLFNLLKSAATEIRKAATEELLSNEDVISLIGRALFTRFLVDRDILKNSELGNVVTGAIDATRLFDTPQAASLTFQWLDKIFNGDLLHLSNRDYPQFFDGLGDKAIKVCLTLGNIMRRASGGQLSLEWDGLRFKHIPVDVLSQVYEHFAHENFPELAQKTSIHYTPRAIAELVVDGTFTALRTEKADATVLDPAAGAGIFLVLAFRRLVGELWLRQKRRPNRKQIRKILNTQLCGMDINPESLKMAALSLYLAALELDPDPQPLSDLIFDELFDKVLHCVEEKRLLGKDAHLGSLAQGIPNIGQFDIVMGNPPWTPIPGSNKKFLDAIAARVVKPLLNGIGITETNNLVNRQVPDLAFLWKSMQWCKPKGAIGCLLDARLLFNADHFDARCLLFSLFRVTGILNATALRNEKRVWASHNKPFCALVGINEKPQLGDSFYYLNPYLEKINKVGGEIRLDPNAALPVPCELVTSTPYLLKVLFKGSALDLNLIQRLDQMPRRSFEQFVTSEMSSEIHQGYRPNGKTKSAKHIADLPSLETSDKPEFEVKFSQLNAIHIRYPQLLMEWPRPRAIYEGPLILFREAPKFDRKMRGAIWSAKDVAFNRSYYGLPFKNNLIGEYLFILSYSDLFVYWALLTSAKFGVERETFLLEDVGTFPIEPFSTLPKLLKDMCHQLALQIRRGECPWSDLEEFVRRVYKLNDLDWQLVDDAVSYELTYRKSQIAAEKDTNLNSPEFIGFASEVQSSLIALVDESLSVHGVSVPSLESWLFIEIIKGQPTSDHRVKQLEAAFLTAQIANVKSFWTTHLRFQIGQNHWLIGQPRQARYWSKSKGRLMALQLSEARLFASNLAN